MKRGVAIALATLAHVVQLAGCATSAERQVELEALFQVGPDPTLFAAERSANTPQKLPIKVALLVPPVIPGGSATLPSLPGHWIMTKKESPTSWRLQTWPMVEMALLKALGEAVEGESNSVLAMPAPGAGFSVTLELVSVRFDYDERLRYLVPLPFPYLYLGSVGEFEALMQLHMQLSLFDVQGHQVWTKAYDDDIKKGVWAFQTGNAARPGDLDWLPGVKRVAHEAAWRLSQQVVHDLRDWHDAERLKPRSP